MIVDNSELCMLEQLCYLNSDVAKAIGIKGFKGITSKRGEDRKTIEVLLQGFDDTALAKLEALGDKEVGGACISGKEWADIIRYIKKDENLKDLVLTDTMENSSGTTLALCFAESVDSTEAIVAFKGTSGGEEWIDNVEGLNMADTRCQKEALDFIESLKYENITTIGHSKGGNKAMYVAITSDKVTRCVAFDAQGFSQKFLDKYWAEIQTKGKNISNYSIEGDYVHALMFQIPNTEQIYCIGYGVANIKQLHSPNSFFLQDNGGNLWLDESGNIVIGIGEEEASIGMLHNFTTFIINNADEKDKVQIIEYISKLLSLTFGGANVKTQDIMDFALSDPDSLALIIAYLAKYMDVYDLGTEDINGLLDTLGLNCLNELIPLKKVEAFGYRLSIYLNLVNIIKIVKWQLTDDDDDWIVKNILPILKEAFFKDMDIDIKALWEKINSKVKTIDASKGIEPAEVRTGVIRDFSANVYEGLMSVIAKMENESFTSVETWSNYATEEWYAPLLVSTAIKGIMLYFDKVSETNSECKRKINMIFENVQQIDIAYAGNISESNGNLQTMKNSLLQV